ncbi:MAG: hypothetical protein ACR2MG_09715 [Pyrinomonadaceae bacterium]
MFLCRSADGSSAIRARSAIDAPLIKSRIWLTHTTSLRFVGGRAVRAPATNNFFTAFIFQSI